MTFKPGHEAGSLAEIARQLREQQSGVEVTPVQPTKPAAQLTPEASTTSDLKKKKKKIKEDEPSSKKVSSKTLHENSEKKKKKKKHLENEPEKEEAENGTPAKPLVKPKTKDKSTSETESEIEIKSDKKKKKKEKRHRAEEDAPKEVEADVVVVPERKPKKKSRKDASVEPTDPETEDPSTTPALADRPASAPTAIEDDGKESSGLMAALTRLNSLLSPVSSSSSSSSKPPPPPRDLQQFSLEHINAVLQKGPECESEFYSRCGRVGAQAAGLLTRVIAANTDLLGSSGSNPDRRRGGNPAMTSMMTTSTALAESLRVENFASAANSQSHSSAPGSYTDAKIWTQLLKHNAAVWAGVNGLLRKHRESQEPVVAEKQHATAGEGDDAPEAKTFRDFYMSHFTDAFGEELERMREGDTGDHLRVDFLVYCIEAGIDVFSDVEKQLHVDSLKPMKARPVQSTGA